MNLVNVVDFSHSLLFIHDVSITCPGLDWRDEHTLQGFARADGVVNLGLSQDFGIAVVSHTMSEDVPWKLCDRALLVPFRCTASAICMSGTGDSPPYGEILVEPGDYGLTIAERVARTGRRPVVEIYLCFERLSIPIEKSRILKSVPGTALPDEIVENTPFV